MLSCVGVAFNSMAGFLGTFFMAEKSTNHILYTTLIVAMINTVMCSLFIDQWKLIGAAGILTVSFLLLMILRLIILTKKFSVSFDYKLMFFLSLFVFVYIEYSFKTSILFDVALFLSFAVIYAFSIKKYIKLYLMKKKV